MLLARTKHSFSKYDDNFLSSAPSQYTTASNRSDNRDIEAKAIKGLNVYTVLSLSLLRND